MAGTVVGPRDLWHWAGSCPQLLAQTHLCQQHGLLFQFNSAFLRGSNDLFVAWSLQDYICLSGEKFKKNSSQNLIQKRYCKYYLFGFSIRCYGTFWPYHITFWPTQYVVRNCRHPRLRLYDLETQEEPEKVISGAFKGQGFTEQIQEEGSPRINLERINGFSNIEEKWIGSERGVNVTAKPPQLGGEQACWHFLERRSCQADCTVCLVGTVPPKTAPHRPCQDCKGLCLPPLKHLHQLAFTLMETISKLIIWIFFPLAFVFNTALPWLVALNTSTCSLSLLPLFSRQGLWKQSTSGKSAN